MFEFLKNILGKTAGDETGGQPHSTPKTTSSAAPKGSPGRTITEARPTARLHTNGNGHDQTGQNGNSDSVHVPLESVLSGLPLELKARVKQTDVGGGTLSISVQSVLS